MRIFIALTATAALSAVLVLPAKSAKPLVSTPVVTQVVPPVFQPFYQGPIVSDERAKAAREALPFESITLERSGGMLVPGGLFRLTLHKDGAATLWTDGSRFGRAGEYTGTVYLFDYAKVSHLITETGFERLAPRYAVRWSDMTENTVTVATRDRRIGVTDYGGAGPIQLWAVQRAIEAIGLTIRWNSK